MANVLSAAARNRYVTQPPAIAGLPAPVAAHLEHPSQLGIVFNLNSRRVTNPRVRRWTDVLPPGVRFATTTTLAEADDVVARFIEQDARVLVSAGGDGTAVQLYCSVRKALDANGSHPEPLLALLKLGTGNGLATFLGARRPADDLQRLLSGARLPARAVGMLSDGTGYAHLMGVGWDAEILHDYAALVREHPQLAGGAGYFRSVSTITIPRMRGIKTEVEVTNGDDGGYRVAAGDRLVPLEGGRGELLYRGPITIIGCGAAPYFGFHFVAFPFWRHAAGMYNLRLFSTPILEIVRHLPQNWVGEYRSPRIRDFLVKRAVFKFGRPVGFQRGGDAAGTVETIAIAFDRYAQLVDYAAIGRPTAYNS